MLSDCYTNHHLMSACWLGGISSSKTMFKRRLQNELKQHKVTWWHLQMKILSAILAICAWNSPVTGEFHLQRPWRGALMFSLICAWINGWINNREAGDLRRHRTHSYGVTTKIQWVNNDSSSRWSRPNIVVEYNAFWKKFENGKLSNHVC